MECCSLLSYQTTFCSLTNFRLLSSFWDSFRFLREPRVSLYAANEKTENIQKVFFVLICIFFASQAYQYTRRAKKCEAAENGGLKWTRTTDLTLIRRALYPPELWAHVVISVCLSDLFPLPLGSGVDERDRTDDPLLAKQVLSQLSYTPVLELHLKN